MERHPSRPRRRVQQSVQDRPIGDGIRAIPHRFGLAERGRDGARVQVVAPDHDRCRELAPRDQVVQGAAEPRPLPLPQPADPGRQPLERHPLLRQADPAGEVLVLGEQLERQAVGARQVLGVPRQRHPAERSFPLAEERPDVFGHEPRDRERVGDAGVSGLGANVVAVVERHRPALAQREHRLDVRGDAGARSAQVLRGIAPPQRRRLGDREAGGDVALQGVVRRRLIGQDIGHPAAAGELGQHHGAVSHQADRHRLSRPLGGGAPRERLVQ